MNCPGPVITCMARDWARSVIEKDRGAASVTSSAYLEKTRRLGEVLRRTSGVQPGLAPRLAPRLAKDTSNLFRNRTRSPTQALDVRDFNQVLSVDPAAGVAEVEGMTTYADLVAACLAQNVMPAVVPQLKTITVGGAVAGCGIESSSFRYGLVHESVQEMEILLGDGSTVVCTPDNAHSDLFFGFPNSYGTLGYALRLRLKVVPVSRHVKLSYLRFTRPTEYFSELARQCDRLENDFVDGVIFAPDDMVISLGQFVEDAPYTSDYTYRNIYYKSLRERTEDFLTTEDYLWRWDTDWFWCSKNLLAQHPLVRRLYGRRRLNSATYTRIMRWNARWKFTHYLDRLRGIHSESVIQDVDIPIENAPAFLSFYTENIGFMPVWTCPTRAFNKAHHFSLYPLDPEKLYVNFGFWDVIRETEKRPPGFYNRQVEDKVLALGGIKSLYSDSYFSAGQFWDIYNKPVYDQLKRHYDAGGVFTDLYAKCVLRD
jgi:FAD/FMN-containing dehydrogenase